MKISNFALGFLLFTALATAAGAVETTSSWLNKKPNGFKLNCQKLLSSATSSIETLSQQYKSAEISSLSRGQEIEGYAPTALGREGLAAAIRDALAKEYGDDQVAMGLEKSDISAWHDRYRVDYSVPDENGGHVIKSIFVKRDPSLPNRPGYIDVEINSPVIHTETHSVGYEKALVAASKAGFVVDDVFGGLHLHYGFQNFRSTEVAVLLIVFDFIHVELESLLKVSPERKEFNNRLTPEMLKRLHAVANVYTNGEVERAGWILQLARDPRLGGERNHALNILNLGTGRINTVEFRMPNSTVSPVVREALDNFLMALIIAVRNKSPALLNLVIKAEKLNLPVTLEDLFRALDLNYDHFLSAIQTG